MSEWTVDPVALKHVCPNLDDRQASDIARGLGEAFHRYGIDNERRAAMAVAQWAEESDHFKTSEEYASGSAYEGRRDLGNTHPGDGVRFKGRGRIMITGRLNYTAMARVLELDLVAHPELLGQPPHSELASGQWWHDHECNTFCDRDDFKGLTRRINGGLNRFDERCRPHGLAQGGASKRGPRGVWSAPPDDEGENMAALAPGRRIAKRPSGGEELAASPLPNASTAKPWPMDGSTELERLPTAEADGWGRATR